MAASEAAASEAAASAGFLWQAATESVAMATPATRIFRRVSAVSVSGPQLGSNHAQHGFADWSEPQSESNRTPRPCALRLNMPSLAGSTSTKFTGA